jgi:DNA modification methylase
MAIDSLSQLTPDPHNRRAHTPRNLEMLRAALAKVGAARSIVIDEDGGILAGNGLVAAASSMGLSKVKVVDVDGDTIVAVRRSGLSVDEKRDLAIYDNRTAELAEWNWDQLAADQRAGLSLEAWWTREELPQTIVPGRTDPDEVPPERPTGIVAGDLFELGPHRLLCGDCAVAGDVARLMGDVRADCAVTSPPYPGAEMWATDGPALVKVGHDCLVLMRDVLKPGAALAWNTSDVPCGQVGVQPNPARDTIDALQIGWTKRAEIVWEKGLSYLPAPWNTRRPTVPNCTHELILVFFNGERLPREKDGHLDDDALTWNRESVWKISPAKASVENHRAPFPVELPVRCLQLFSLDGDVCYEPFAGSGTTIIAAEQLRRRCVGVELQPSYCQVIIDRWEAFTGQRAVKVGDARP